MRKASDPLGQSHASMPKLQKSINYHFIYLIISNTSKSKLGSQDSMQQTVTL